MRQSHVHRVRQPTANGYLLTLCLLITAFVQHYEDPHEDVQVATKDHTKKRSFTDKTSVHALAQWLCNEIQTPPAINKDTDPTSLRMVLQRLEPVFIHKHDYQVLVQDVIQDLEQINSPDTVSDVMDRIEECVVAPSSRTTGSHDEETFASSLLGRRSVLGLFARKFVLSVQRLLFEGLSRLYQDVVEYRIQYHKCTDLSLPPSQHVLSPDQLEFVLDDSIQTIVAGYDDPSSPIPSTVDNYPDTLFVAYLKAVRSRAYETALKRLHQYHDVALSSFRQLRSLFRTCPSSTNTLVSSSSTYLGSGVQYVALNVAGCHLLFDRFNVAEESLYEAIRIAQHHGDHHCVSLALSWLEYVYEKQGKGKGTTSHLHNGLDCDILEPRHWTQWSVMKTMPPNGQIIYALALKQVKMSIENANRSSCVGQDILFLQPSIQRVVFQVLVQWCLHRGEYKRAETMVKRVVALSPASSDYPRHLYARQLEAIVWGEQQSYTQCFQQLHKLEMTCRHALAMGSKSMHIVLIHILVTTAQYHRHAYKRTTSALSIAMEAIQLCHSLPNKNNEVDRLAIHAHFILADVYLIMGRAKEAIELVEQHLRQVMEEGHLLVRAEAFLVLAKAKMTLLHQSNKDSIRLQDEIRDLLEQSRNLFTACDQWKKLQEISMFQAMLTGNQQFAIEFQKYTELLQQHALTPSIPVVTSLYEMEMILKQFD